MPAFPSRSNRHFFLTALVGVLFFISSPAFTAHASYGIPSSTIVLYHFNSSTVDTQGNANLNVGSSSGPYVDMLTNLSKAIDVESPSSFNSSNTISINGKTEATIGGWILPTSTNQNQAVPFGTESGDLFQQLSGYKIRCDLPDFHDYDGTTVISTSTPTFVACVYKNSHEDLYINGVIDGSGASVPASISESASKVDVGNWTGQAKWTGYLDDAFIVPVALSSSTLSSIYFNGNGRELCATDGCGSTTSYTPILSSSTQYKADGVTTLAEGTSTAEYAIVLKGTINSTSTNYLDLEVEVQPASTTFTNIATASSALITAGQTASITIDTGNLVDGNYHWQARAVDTGDHSSSTWTEFGTAGNTDFVIGGRPIGYEISDGTLKALYHFNNNTTDTVGTADLNVGTSGGGYVDMLSKLNQAKDVEAPSSFNSTNNVGLSGYASATIGAWILPSADQNQTVPFGTEAGDLFQQISGYKVRCDLPDFNDYNGSTAMSTSTPTFVVCVYNNSHEDLYINGVKDGAGASVPASISETASQVHVGNWGGGANWNGHLDEAFIISKALSTSTITSLYNGGAGTEICLTAGCNDLGPTLSGLNQYLSDGSTPLGEGSSTTENAVKFGATLHAAVTSTVQFQAEVQQAGVAFTNVANVSSTFVASGTAVTVSMSFNTNRPYHWQARAVDSRGAASSWQNFGTQPLDIDFRVSSLANAASEYFNGSSSLTYSAASDTFRATSTFSIEFWYRTPEPTSSVVSLIDMRTSSTREGYFTNRDMDSGIQFFMNCDSGVIGFHAASATIRVSNTGGNDKLGTWHQVAITKNSGTASSAFAFYYDGASTPIDWVGGGPISGNCYDPSSANSIWFGQDALATSTPNYLVGNLDEVRIWNIAKSSASVANDWNQEVISSGNLLSRWSFNANSTESRALGFFWTPNCDENESEITRRCV